MNGIFSRVTFDSEIRVFTTQVEPNLDQQSSREQEQPQAGLTWKGQTSIPSLGIPLRTAVALRAVRWRADSAARSLRLFDNGEFSQGNEDL